MAQPRVNNRRRSLPNSSFEEASATPSRVIHRRQFVNTINQSLELPPPSAASRQYRSIEYDSIPEDRKSIRSDRVEKRSNTEQDRVLQKLGQKNEDMRK